MKTEEMHVSVRCAYWRMAGYVFTILLHTINWYFMVQKFQGPVLEHPDIKFFVHNQTRFFTSWTFFFQIVYAFIGLICDILVLANSYKSGYKLHKRLRGLRDTFFAAIQWPSSLLVATLFWGFYLYDKRLILPPKFDQVLTPVSNHVIHTAIVPIVFWELVFRPRSLLSSHLRNLLHLAVHFLIYMIVLIYTRHEQGRWLYPVCGQLYGSISFPILTISVAVMCLVYYYIQWPLTRLFWGDVVKKHV